MYRSNKFDQSNNRPGGGYDDDEEEFDRDLDADSLEDDF